MNKIKDSYKPSYSEYGKIPPQAIDLEEAVLGALLIEGHTIDAVIDIITAECFYKDEHSIIYNSMLTLRMSNKNIDILTVIEQLRKTGDLEQTGGPVYISQLTNKIGSAANIEYHARIILEKYILRELIRVSSEIQKDAFEETTDLFELLDETEQKITKVLQFVMNSAEPVLAQNLLQKFSKMLDQYQSGEKTPGIPSSLTSVNETPTLYMNTDLIIIAARPGMGKSALMIEEAKFQSQNSYPVAIFSLEMSWWQLLAREISNISGVEYWKFKKAGYLNSDDMIKINSAYSMIEQSGLYIDDTPSLTMRDIKSKARKLKSKGIRAIYIDYLQLIKVIKKSERRELDVSEISVELKHIAKELDLPVIAFAQLSRDVEKRGGSKRPILSDLRESGALEQNADVVIFLYRPEYYGIYEDEEGLSTKNMCEIIIAKSRHTSISTHKVQFDGALSKFQDRDIIKLEKDIF